MKKIALIIGTGAFGPIAVQVLPKNTYITEIFALPGCPLTNDHPHQVFDLDQLSPTFKALAEFAPDEVCMIGGVNLTDTHRQNLVSHFTTLFGIDALSQFHDPKTIPGDQAASFMMAKIIADIGANIIGIHQLIPDLITPQGQIGAVVCPENLHRQIPTAISQCLAHARQDKGQAVIIADNELCAAEQRSGTAAMLANYAATSPKTDKSAILIKCARPGQPLAIDMPAIGPDTIDQAANAQIGLILVEAARSLLIERVALIAKADAAGIALLGINVEEDDG